MKTITENSIFTYAHEHFSNKTMTAKYLAEYDKTGNNTRKQRILLIDVNCKNSSTGNIVYDLYQAAREDGRDAAVCYGRGERIEEENLFKFGLYIETYIHAGLSRITGYNGCFSPLSTRRLINYIEKFKPDVIHIHELHAYFVNIRPIINYIKSKKIPLIWTFHCEYMYTGKCGHALECDRFMTACGNCPHLKEYPKSLLIDKTSQMLKWKKDLLGSLDFTIITPSQWMADRVKLSFLKDKPIAVIHNGVDTNIFYPRNDVNIFELFGLDSNKKIIMSVAHNVMSEAKGGRFILELAQDEQLENVQFVMVGVESEELEKHEIHTLVYGDQEIRFAVKEYTRGNKVYFISLFNEKKLLACLYSAADMYLLTSQRETYSLPCAEALCCGTPVIGFKCGAPETVFEAQYANFIPYGDVKAVRNQIQYRDCFDQEKEYESITIN